MIKYEEQPTFGAPSYGAPAQPNQPSGNYCQKCGAFMEPGAQFCPKCGNRNS
ncbi:MAG: zinc-ribbon domain-containing protein [Methanomassiliicoccales archaeon]|nr:zinc-ribbon domain-containing protein [Methanomassiliicoccales archaeon]